MSVYEADRLGFDGVLRRALDETRLKANPDAAAIAASALAAGVLGVLLALSHILAASLVAIVALLAVIGVFDLLGIAVILTATVPWLIVLSGVLPRLILTFTAGATALVILMVVKPRSDGSKTSFLLRLGIVLFFAPAVISLGRDGSAEGFIQAAKYIVFPVMVMAVTEATNRRDLFRLRTVALWSGFAAVTVNLFIGLAGVTHSDYYDSGEILGFGAGHVLALLAGCLTAASLASGLSLSWAPVIAIGAIATVATGVRSALPGLALVAIVRMVSGGVRFRMIVLVALAVVSIFASGAAGVVEARYHRGESQGEYSSFNSFGSGRGSVYSVAVESWWGSSPIDLAAGTGLRSIRTFEEERTGVANVGHSDIIEVGVQLGIVGLIGLLLIWRVLIERAESRLPLFVLGSFALFNGMLEYSGSVVVALVLTAGLKRHPEPSPDA